MAIIKSIELSNGVNVNYHRVVSVNNVVNVSSIIEVASYTSEAKREEEKESLKNKNDMNVFIDTKYIPTSYNPEMNVNSAYEYLKSLDCFKGYKDV